MISLEMLKTLSLDILALEKVRPDTWWNFKAVNSPFSRLYLVDEGQAFVRHHGQTWTLPAGTLHLVPGFIPCDYFCHEPFDLYYLSFTARLTGGCDLFSLGKFDFSVPAGKSAKKLFERLIDLNPDRALLDYNPYKTTDQIFPPRKTSLTPNEIADEVESTGILRQLLSPILRTGRAASGTANTGVRRFDPVLFFIENHLDRPIELSELADIAGLRPTYFSDLFDRTFGERPSVFISRRRIEKAQTLLLTTDLQVQEIADRCGFCSTPHFTRTFQQYTGNSPLQYRKTHHSF